MDKIGLYWLAISSLYVSPPVAAAQEASPRALEVSGDYTVDTLLISGKGCRNEVYALDNLNLRFDADLDQVVGWKGAIFHLHLLNNLGGMPNAGAGTLQGVDNIEVGSRRPRVFEA